MKETKSIVRKMKNLKFCIGFSYCLAINCEWRSGGLVLFWLEDIGLEILSHSKFYVDA